METLYENARMYAQILRNCSLPQVSKWGLDDVNRAFHWAEYFMTVHKRTVNKASLVSKLDSKLKKIGRDLGIRFGEKEFSYQFITHGPKYFTKALLDNPLLPKELEDEIVSWLSLDSDQHLDEQDRSKQVLTALRSMKSLLTDSLDEEDILHDLKSLDACYLRKDIAWLLLEVPPAAAVVEERLTNLSGIEGGMEVILLSLLLDSDPLNGFIPAPACPETLDVARRAIFDWLLETLRHEIKEKCHQSISLEDKGKSRPGLLHHYKLLAQASRTYLDIFKEHFKFLVHKMEEIDKLTSQFGDDYAAIMDHGVQPSLEQEKELGDNDVIMDSDGAAVQPLLEQEKSLDDVAMDHNGAAVQPLLKQEKEHIISHWIELALTGEHIKEVCLPFLKSRAFPHCIPEEQKVSRNSFEDCSYGGYTLHLPILRENIWYMTLKAVLSEHNLMLT